MIYMIDRLKSCHNPSFALGCLTSYKKEKCELKKNQCM